MCGCSSDGVEGTSEYVKWGKLFEVPIISLLDSSNKASDEDSVEDGTDDEVEGNEYEYFNTESVGNCDSALTPE